MLKIRGLDVSYGAIRALTNLSLHIAEGEYVTMIGANGAGKTTLLSAISGLISASADVLEYDRRDIRGLRPEMLVRAGICHVPEGRRVFAEMSVADNLEMGAHLSLQRDGRAEVNRLFDQVYTQFPRLAERRRQAAGTLSGGEQQMLAIGRALMGKPRLLLMDEPTVGLAPLIIDEIFEHIDQMRHQGGPALLLVEQNAHRALELCSRGYVLENGRVILQGPSEELLASNDVKRAYLGKDYKEKWER